MPFRINVYKKRYTIAIKMMENNAEGKIHCQRFPFWPAVLLTKDNSNTKVFVLLFPITRKGKR
jgi:hypothetical protein